MIRSNLNRIVLSIGLASGAAVGFAQTTTVTHLEENDPGITYSGAWYTIAQSGDSAGHADAANQVGSVAKIAFNGTGITWVGTQDPSGGVARVFLDGTPNVVDTYADTTHYQQPLFTAQTLAQGPHTLSIEVTPMRNANSTGSWIWVDGFDIQNGAAVTSAIVASAGHIEQNDSSVTYTGTWYLNSNPAESGGTAVLAIDPGATATVKFNGTGITWTGYRDEWSGIAPVYVDGVLKTTVDTYGLPMGDGNSNPLFRKNSYSISGLPSGAHDLKIVVTGTHGSLSASSWIWIDSFDIAP
jgi:hypothetical protein